MSSLQRRSGLTLLEVVITGLIIAILGATALWMTEHARSKAREVRCAQNLAQISKAIWQYYHDHRECPPDGPGSDLAEDLAPYLKEADIFRCPQDIEKISPNSYQPFYISRTSPEGTATLIIGCPRHKKSTWGATLFNLGTVGISELGRVIANGKVLEQAAPDEERTISSGSMEFADGSRVTITSAQPEYKVTLIYSARMADNTLYSLVRVQGGGKIDVAVTPGSRFEVVTPVAIAGVKGTRFTVETYGGNGGATVNVSEGVVWVQNRINNHIETLHQGQEVTVGSTSNTPECIKCPKHCKVTPTGKQLHCSRCPLHESNKSEWTQPGKNGWWTGRWRKHKK